MKIHISLEMKMLLDSLGGFRTEHRGLVEIKSRGLVDTFWLMGKEGGVLSADMTLADEAAATYNAEEGPEYMKDLSDYIDMSDRVENESPA